MTTYCTEATYKDNHDRFRRCLLPVCLAASLILLMSLSSGCCTTGPSTSEEHRFTVAEPATLEISAGNTKVDVQTEPGGQIRILATLWGSDELGYEVAQNGSTITVTIETEASWWSAIDAPHAELDIIVPPQTALDINTSNGSVLGNGTSGTAYVRTSNGEITFKNASGDFDLETSNGEIEFEGVEGTAVIRTSNGELNLLDFSGQIDGETSNGPIEFEGDLTPGSSNRLSTSNGAVELDFGTEPNIDLDAATSNGGIECDFPITATVTGDDRLVGTIGAGGTELEIRTSNGDVTIR